MARSPMASMLLAAACVPAGFPDAVAQELDYGPHGVGFRVIEARDSSRAFRPERDAAGLSTGETARPVQVSLWYPAATDDGGARMLAGDFRLLRESELDFEAPGAAEAFELRRDFIEAAVGFGTERARAAALWDAPTPAVRDLLPLPGPHPAVLHVGAVGVSNPLLPAYLASHGFVVASYPSNGRMTEASLEFSPNALTLDTGVDDVGFVHALLRRLPLVDERRLAVLSFSGSSLVALLWQMRDMQGDALVAVEGWERYRRGVDVVRESVHYDPARVRVPFLMIERAPAEALPLYAKVGDVVDSLRYASIRRVAFRDAAHGDFLSHVTAGQTEGQPLIYASAARMVRLFLEAHLLDDARAAATLAALRPPAEAGEDFFTAATTEALPAAPSEEEFFRLAETDPAEAVRAWREAASREPGRPLFREHVLTRAAIFARSPEDRALLMELVVEAHPRSVAARWRLAEALRGAGRVEEARAALAEGLARVDGDPALDEAAREEWRERIRTALAGRGSGAQGR